MEESVFLTHERCIVELYKTLHVHIGNDDHYIEKELEQMESIDRISLLFYVCGVEEDLDMAQELIDAGVNVNAKHRMHFNRNKPATLLRYAVHEKNQELFRFLLKQKDINMNEVEGTTILHEIVNSHKRSMDESYDQIRRAMITELMTYQKFNPNILDKKGISALQLAASERNNHFLAACISGFSKTDINIQTPACDLAPIHYMASLSRNQDVHKYWQSFFCRISLDVNVQTKGGLTACYILCRSENNSREFLKRLLKCEDLNVNIVYRRTGRIAIQAFVDNYLQTPFSLSCLEKLLNKTENLLKLRQPLKNYEKGLPICFWNRRLVLYLMAIWNYDLNSRFNKFPLELLMRLFSFCEFSPVHVYSYFNKT